MKEKRWTVPGLSQLKATCSDLAARYGGLAKIAVWACVPWPSPRPWPAWPAQPSDMCAGRALGQSLRPKRRRWCGSRRLTDVCCPTESSPRAWVTPGEHARQGVGTRGSPERLGGLEVRRSNSAPGFRGGGGSPTNGGDFPVVLQRSGPSRDKRGRMNWSKTHQRVALTRSWALAATAQIPTQEMVLRRPERIGGGRGGAVVPLGASERKRAEKNLSLLHGGESLEEAASVA
jgi:hypothetical protein